MSIALYAASVMTVNVKSVIGLNLEEKAKIAGKTLAGESESWLRVTKRHMKSMRFSATVPFRLRSPVEVDGYQLNRSCGKRLRRTYLVG